MANGIEQAGDTAADIAEYPCGDEESNVRCQPHHDAKRGDQQTAYPYPCFSQYLLKEGIAMIKQDSTVAVPLISVPDLYGRG